jgi:hypothetical protein
VDGVTKAAPAIDLELGDVLEPEAMASVMQRLAPLFAGGSGDDSGLFVASPNAGSATALRFWADAMRDGVALASPQLFPWCLANSPCAALARQFAITGPSTTWLGGDEAMAAAWSAAERAVSRRQVQRAYVVRVVFGGGRPQASGRLQAWRLEPDGGMPREDGVKR